MDHTLLTPFFKAKNYNKINFCASYGKIDSSNNELFSMIKEEAMSVSTAYPNMT